MNRFPRVRLPRAAWLLALPAIALPLAVQAAADTDTLDGARRASVIDGALARLDEAYVFPDVARRMAESVRARVARGEYEDIRDGGAFARKLTEDLRAVSRDRHLRVIHHPAGAPQDADGAAAGRDEREQFARTNYGFDKAERLQGNIGYLEITRFPPRELAADTAAAAMGFVANADALIIDLRRNGGGAPPTVAFVQSYLFDQRTHLNDIYERVGDRTREFWTETRVPGQKFGGSKPVFVLTSQGTFSGGEEFAYNLQQLRRGTVVGEVTGGGAHPVRPFPIDAGFSIGVPFARAINPITKTNWEGTGVQPDVATPASEARDVAYRLALEKLVATAGDEARKQQWRDLLSGLKPP